MQTKQKTAASVSAGNGASHMRRSLPAALEGLRDIFTAFTEPPESPPLPHFETDPKRRMMDDWRAVGDDLRLAMGQAVTREIDFPGGKIRVDVQPACADPQHTAALRKARENTPGADAALSSSDNIVRMRLTGKEAEDFLEMLRADGFYGR